MCDFGQVGFPIHGAHTFIADACARTLSMTFGRPMTIPEEHVQLPLPQPENNALLAVVAEEPLPTEEARSVAFFNATM